MYAQVAQKHGSGSEGGRGAWQPLLPLLAPGWSPLSTYNCPAWRSVATSHQQLFCALCHPSCTGEHTALPVVEPWHADAAAAYSTLRTGL